MMSIWLLGQLAGEAHVLAAAADRQRQLVVGHHHFDPALFLVEHDAADGRRLERVDHERRGVLAPRDDVDLLALQFLHHRLDAAALHADAGADRVDAELSRLITPILARLPGSRAAALISMMPS